MENERKSQIAVGRALADKFANIDRTRDKSIDTGEVIFFFTLKQEENFLWAICFICFEEVATCSAISKTMDILDIWGELSSRIV